MKVIAIADEIYREIGAPSDLSPNAIAYWIRGNIGALNNLIFTSFALSSNGAEIDPELGLEEKDIMKKMYGVYFYGEKVRNSLGAAAYDILELTQDGDTIRKVNKNELSKSYVQMKKMESDELKDLIRGYKSKSATPRQVTGDDNFTGPDSGTDEFIRTP